LSDTHQLSLPVGSFIVLLYPMRRPATRE